MAYLPQFISPKSEQPLLGMLLLGGVFMLMTFGVFTVYGFVSSIFSELLVHSKKVSTAIQKIFAGSFAALGLKLAFSERG
ncbi:hypothetical protein [Halarcobacter anaerophilus]|uniref:hypothetical protein n=1 Tax=Halarcobacter anaerophilus TaxID=877500 RepID=UPI0006966888|nr:hypothetical protein [Halarcobacter anaerophilus]